MLCDNFYFNEQFFTSFQIELATGSYPYKKWKTPFEQLKQVVQDPPPKLPPGKFSAEFEDFITNW
jgi:hypothetical protein